MLLALLQSKVVCDIELERFLTAVRRALLQFASAPDPDVHRDKALRLSCALAQQCFINEYIFALSDTERDQSQALRERLIDAVDAGAVVEPLNLAIVAMYAPLHALPIAASLPSLSWPEVLAVIIKQQICDPLEDASTLAAIPTLAAADNEASLRVQVQYDENPYPRWILLPPTRPTTIAGYLRDALGIEGLPQARGGEMDILIAGCGTGAHSIETAQRFPQSRVLAVDISRVSLAYAQRKTREAGLTNVDYAQADILKLPSIERRFDLIEAMGVLHHLPDPAEGWRTLLALLRPGGLMLVGVFSSHGRRPVNAARAFAAERGYSPTLDDIRLCRQELIHQGKAMATADFYSTSGCRALWFNAVERQFTIPEIKAFLEASQLNFLGFESTPDVRCQFAQRYPWPGALTDLDCWQSFEEAYPWTFATMYTFWIQKPPGLWR
jgi:SAM-dependent methyltransferase